MASTDLEFGVLGPLVVVRGDAEITLTRRQRLVLACLLVDLGTVVPAERLVAQIWGATPPMTGTGPVRTYVWELRRLLDPGNGRSDRATVANGASGEVLVNRGDGYVLHVDGGRLDRTRFERDLAGAREASSSGRPERALACLDGALGLWRGPAFGDLAGEAFLQPEAVRLDELHVAARELRAELLLITREPERAAVELAPLTQAHPQRERLWALRMTALYRAGRQGEALRCYQDARSSLVESMGIEPGRELRGLEHAILTQDPALDWRPLPSQRSQAPPPHSRSSRSSPDGAAEPRLPRSLTSLVGRGAEREAVARVLDSARLVTLSGGGGCGKTRLALGVAEDVRPRFPGGVGFVDLTAVDDPGLLATAVAEASGVEVDPAAPLESIVRRIDDDPVLLVLDNCEHLVDAVAGCAEHLLVRCPSLRILATSRVELHLAAETVWRVPGLGLPPENGDDDPRHHDRLGHDGHDDEDGQDDLLAAEAVQLFVERGRSVLSDFAPRGQALRDVARICRRLDGMPLAIELAAGLVGSLPVAEIADRLDDRFRLLTDGFRQSPPRHQTLRATLGWSFDLLDEPAQRLFAELGVFVGSFTLPAAEAVAGGGEVACGIARLVQASMLDCESGPDGAQRYRMLETVRQYARELLDRQGLADEVQRRHARCYAGVAVAAERQVHGPVASAALAGVVAELPNLRAAVRWAMAHDEIEIGLDLASALQWLFARMALLDELTSWLDVALARRAQLRPDLRLKAVTSANTVAFLRGELHRVHELGEEAIALARQLDDPHQLALALVVSGSAAFYAEDPVPAGERLDEAKDLFARLGDRWGMAWALASLALVTYPGDAARARRLLDEARGIFRSLHDRHGEVFPLVQMVRLAFDAGRPDEALRLAREAAAIAASVEGRDVRHVSRCVLGLAELLVGDAEQARRLLLQSLRDFPGSRTAVMVTGAVEGLAVLATATGRNGDAVALLAFAGDVRDRCAMPRAARWAALVDGWLRCARTVIGSDRVGRELARGRSMSLDEAIDLAESATQPSEVRRRGW